MDRKSETGGLRPGHRLSCAFWGLREMRANVHRFIIADPGDVKGLADALTSGDIDPARIVAVIGKTHGNGLVNDYTRGHLTLPLSTLIAERIGRTRDEVKARIPFIFSGGVEVVLTPHFTVITVEDAPPKSTSAERALAVGVAFSQPLMAVDMGRENQIAATANAVERAMAQAKISKPADVHFVQVKCPAFPVSALQSSASTVPLTDNPGKLMAFGRAASARALPGVLRAPMACRRGYLSHRRDCQGDAYGGAGQHPRTTLLRGARRL